MGLSLVLIVAASGCQPFNGRRGGKLPAQISSNPHAGMNGGGRSSGAGAAGHNGGMACRLDPTATAVPRPVTPLPAPLAWISGVIEEMRRAGLERPHRVRGGRQGREVELDGRTLLNFGSNDYLGYAGDVRLTKAGSKAACAEGFGAGASPLVSGHSQAHERLEAAIADLLDVPAAVTFPSGFAANTATIAALVGPGDLVASDERNHASIIDGCRLSRAAVAVYPHRDVAALDAARAASRAATSRCG